MKCRQCGFDNDELTPRELEVEELLVGGLARKEIATSMKITPSTVDQHMMTVFRKRGVHSAVELTRDYFLRREKKAGEPKP